MVHNTNTLLGIRRIDGVKTGQTAKAGECVILTSARDPIVVQDGTTSHITPRRLIVVVLGSTDRFGEGSALLDRGTTLYDQWAAAGYPQDAKLTL
jgi:D-alanyl-D-alanine carboxypeptidase (penicillin-binding protein 5/6)